MKSQWKHVGDGEKSTFTFLMQLSGEAALKRDHAIMNYIRGVSDSMGRSPLNIHPIALTTLWDDAWAAGFDYRKAQEPEIQLPAPKKKAAKKKRKRS